MKSRTHSTLARDYRGIVKLDGGYGGWRCPCCNPFSAETRKMKTKARRIMRHITKREWMESIEND